MNEKSNGWFNNLSEAQRAEINRASATYSSSRRAIYKRGKVMRHLKFGLSGEIDQPAVANIIAEAVELD